MKKSTNPPKGRYRVQFDFDYNGTGKVMDNTLHTQPDMSLTVRQLLEHHTRGTDSGAQEKTPLYFDIEVPSIRDITDVHDYKKHLEEKLKHTNEFIKQEQKDKLDEEQKEEVSLAKEKNALKLKRKAQKQLDLEDQIKQTTKE